MRRIRSERGFTLIEMMLVVALSFVVILGAGAIYRGVDESFRRGTYKAAGRQNASFLSTTVSRKLRVASDFRVYDSSNPRRDVESGDAISLFDATGLEIDRLVWSSANAALEDSNGVRVGPPNLVDFSFAVDPDAANSVLFTYRVTDDSGAVTEVATAAALRN